MQVFHFLIAFFNSIVYNTTCITGCGSVWGAMGAPPVAESSDLSEWQRSTRDAGACDKDIRREPQQEERLLWQ